MSRRLDLLLTDATGWLRTGLAGKGAPKDETIEQEGRVVRVPEAETRAAEIQALLRLSYPRIQWTVTFELQRRALVDGPFEHYVVVKGMRRDGTSIPPIQIFWRNAASMPASKLVKQIQKGLRLGN